LETTFVPVGDGLAVSLKRTADYTTENGPRL